MKKAVFTAVIAMATAFASAQNAEQTLSALMPEIFAKSEAHYRSLLKAMAAEKPDRFPRSFKDGKLAVIDPPDWCSGFFPGSLWYLYEYTGEAFWKKQAVAYTERLIEPLRHDANNHDVGFRTYCSAGNALRLTGEKRYAEFLHDTAAALRTRYDEKLKLIRSWDSREGGRYNPNFMVIIDNMMNLELLEWDAKNGGSALSHEIACNQADSTDRHHFRADSSAYHVLSYDRGTGRIQGAYAGQGACAEGTWARGQSWAIYGFTMMYRETKNPRYLVRAIRCADYWLEAPNVPADGIPYWDFKAPRIPHEERDASAAAITASALLELSAYAPGFKGAAYRAGAVRILLSLASDAYFAKPGENGGFLLKHSVGYKPGGSEIDVPLNYADYYFLEALLRFRSLAAAPDGRVKVDARHLPDRMDDFCWENPFCGMRAYGPQLAKPSPEGQGLVTCGIDVFNKGVADVTMVDSIRSAMRTKRSYHTPNGRCFDSYTVGTGRGCGGIARRGANGLWRKDDGNWKEQRILEKTAGRVVFELVYDTYVLRGTATADTPFVRFEATPTAAVEDGALWGPGIDISASRGHSGVQQIDPKAGYAANYEPSTANWTMTAIVVDPSSRPVSAQFSKDGSLCLMVPANRKLVFYAGAAWGGAGVFTAAEKWFEYVRAFAER